MQRVSNTFQQKGGKFGKLPSISDTEYNQTFVRDSRHTDQLFSANAEVNDRFIIWSGSISQLSVDCICNIANVELFDKNLSFGNLLTESKTIKGNFQFSYLPKYM